MQRGDVFNQTGSSGEPFRFVLHIAAQAIIYYEYDISGEGQCGEAAGSGFAGWQLITDNVDKQLHGLLLLGSSFSVPRFKENLPRFLNLLERLVDTSPVPRLDHVDYLALQDCIADAHPCFRRTVVKPLAVQIETIGHLAWASHYLKQRNFSMARCHLDITEEMLKAATPQDLTLTQDALDDLGDELWIHRTRCERAAVETDEPDEPTQRNVESLVNGYLENIKDAVVRDYHRSTFAYWCGLRWERIGGTRVVAPLDWKTALDEAEERFGAAIDHIDNQTSLENHVGAVTVKAAAQLGLSRVVNTRERIAQSLSIMPGWVAEEAKSQLDCLDAFLDTHKATYPAVVKLFEGCRLFEMGDWDKAHTEWDNVPDPAPANNGAAKAKAAALFNTGLERALRGDHPSALSPLPSLLLLGEQFPSLAGYKASHYRRLLQECMNRPSSLTTDDLNNLLQHLSANSPPPTPNIELSGAVETARDSSKDIRNRLKALLPWADFSRYRHQKGADLDLAAVKQSIELAEEFILNNDSGPLGLTAAGQSVTPFPREIWDELTSETKWMFFEEVTRVALQEEPVCSDAPLWKSIVAEYDRHLVTPLRMYYRAEQKGKRQSESLENQPSRYAKLPRNEREQYERIWNEWLFIPSSFTPRVDVDLPWYASEVQKTTAKAQMSQVSNLYNARLELVLLSNLVADKPDAFIKSFTEGLKTLQIAYPVTGVWTSLLLRPSLNLRPKVKNPFWAAYSQDFVSAERTVRDSALQQLGELRNFNSHESKDDPPKPHEVRAAWHYLVATIMVYTNKVPASALGGQIETPGPRDPRRFQHLPK